MRIATWVTAIVLLARAAAAEGYQLVMVEQHGCAYCAAFDREVAPGYEKSAEGDFAPLRRIDLHEPVPDDLSLDSGAVMTPTFILIDGGEELARVEGYPGQEMFWWVLDRMLRENTSFEGGKG